MKKINKNFQDPLGLLIRMLTSGDRIAYSVIFRELFSYLVKPLDWLLQNSERRNYKHAYKSNKPLILIIGGSRSGTTLLYQVLASRLPVSFFTNLGVGFVKAPITFGKSTKNTRYSNRNSFRNYFGSVAGFGAPNDGFHIWDRWFGSDRNTAPEHLSEQQINGLSQFIHTWHETIGKPLLNKNNRNSLCINHFERAYPGQTHYIYIERDPIYVVQSLLMAREHVQGDRRLPWGLGSSAQAEDQDDILRVCHQVLNVNKKIQQGLTKVPSSRIYHLTYEDFCQRPTFHLKKIAAQIKSLEIDLEHIEPISSLDSTNRQKISPSEFSRIKNGLESVKTCSIQEESAISKKYLNPNSAKG